MQGGCDLVWYGKNEKSDVVVTQHFLKDNICIYPCHVGHATGCVMWCAAGASMWLSECKLRCVDVVISLVVKRM